MMRATIVFSIFFFVFFAKSFAAVNVGTGDEKNLILVNGMAEVSIEPNLVVLHIESWAKSPTAKGAQEQQAIQFSKIKSAIEKFKIKKDDIQTENFSVNPEYFWDQKSQVNKIIGYRVSNVMTITHRKIEEAGTFIDAVTTSRSDTSGINVQSISWDYDKKSELEANALADAVKNGRMKAEKMATAAGVSIKAVHKIQHTSYQPPVVRPMLEAKAMMAMDGGAGVAPSTEVNSGQIKVRVDVQLEFEI